MALFGPAGKGTYWRALQLARTLARRGHSLVVLATSSRRSLRFCIAPDREPGVVLVESPNILGGGLSYGWDPLNVAARLAWARGQTFDLVHAFESRPAAIVPALYLQRRRKARLVLDWCDWFGRGGSVEERPNWLLRTALRPVETFFEDHFRAQADGTTVINDVLRRRAVELGVSAETIMRLPNGSDVDGIRPVPQAEARRLLGLPQDALILGYVGAIFERDAVLMAQAFDRIYQAEARGRLLLIGYCNIAVEKMVAVPEAVLRTGLVRYEQIGQYLSACDLCWLPLRDSGANRGRYPLKINDYMAAGRPVVGTAVGEAAELIGRGGFGLLASDQPDDLSRQALTLLHDPERREAMGRRGRELAESEFTWDRIGDELERFYHQVMASAR